MYGHREESELRVIAWDLAQLLRATIDNEEKEIELEQSGPEPVV